VTRVAAYDCGTNSLRLLVADVDPDTGSTTEIVRDMRVVRLGEGVDRTGRISDAALERMLDALDVFGAEVARHHVERTRFCATSAARDARNADVFTAAVHQRVGVEPEVLSGEEEARLSFGGAVRSLDASAPAPRLVVDIGGGSTELILGRSEVEQAHSLDIGSVRLTERHVRHDPATADEIAAVTADIDSALDGADVDLAAARAVIGVAGTVTTVAAGALGLPAYDRARIHHAEVPVSAVQHTVDDYLAMTTAQRRSLGYMHPGRADVIGAGGLVLTRLLARTRVESVLVSEHDILDGIAWSAARGEGH
jgi:exopolyphosphatase/guanosine-5'-triphosphate,3'-diphosphate pyrophosphatase